MRLSWRPNRNEKLTTIGDYPYRSSHFVLVAIVILDAEAIRDYLLPRRLLPEAADRPLGADDDPGLRAQVRPLRARAKDGEGAAERQKEPQPRRKANQEVGHDLMTPERQRLPHGSACRGIGRTENQGLEQQPEGKHWTRKGDGAAFPPPTWSRKKKEQKLSGDRDQGLPAPRDLRQALGCQEPGRGDDQELVVPRRQLPKVADEVHAESDDHGLPAQGRLQRAAAGPCRGKRGAPRNASSKGRAQTGGELEKEPTRGRDPHLRSGC